MNHIDPQKAALRIAPFIHRTPVFTCQSLNQMTGAKLFFKAECHQKVGAFKARGAMNALLKLPENEQKRGVITHSSGNHGQALAWAANQLGIKATVVFPKGSNRVKENAIRGYGADLVLCENNLKSRESTVEELIAKKGFVLIHPYNNYDIIEGQSTCAKELLEDYPELDSLVCPLGGGGLLSGTLISANQRDRKIPVFGIEPALADDGLRSLQAGQIIPSENPKTIADGLKTSLGEHNFAIIQELVEDILVVSEEEIIEATQLIFERMKLVVEPSSAVGLAAVLTHPKKFKDQNVGIIITGGNVTLKDIAPLFKS